MSKYEIISQSQTTPVEFEFLRYVSATAQGLASNRIRNDYKNTVKITDLKTALHGVSLAGLRPAWLNSQMELAGLVAEMNYGKVSQFNTLINEYENALYGYALVTVEKQLTAGE